MQVRYFGGGGGSQFLLACGRRQWDVDRALPPLLPPRPGLQAVLGCRPARDSRELREFLTPRSAGVVARWEEEEGAHGSGAGAGSSGKRVTFAVGGGGAAGGGGDGAEAAAASSPRAPPRPLLLSAADSPPGDATPPSPMPASPQDHGPSAGDGEAPASQRRHGKQHSALRHRRKGGAAGIGGAREPGGGGGHASSGVTPGEASAAPTRLPKQRFLSPEEVQVWHSIMGEKRAGAALSNGKGGWMITNVLPPPSRPRPLPSAPRRASSPSSRRSLPSTAAGGCTGRWSASSARSRASSTTARRRASASARRTRRPSRRRPWRDGCVAERGGAVRSLVTQRSPISSCLADKVLPRRHHVARRDPRRVRWDAAVGRAGVAGPASEKLACVPA